MKAAAERLLKRMPISSPSHPSSMQRASPYASLRWQFLGPTNISGRATDVAVVDRVSSRRIYAAYATSGVWQTDDSGATGCKGVFAGGDCRNGGQEVVNAAAEGKTAARAIHAYLGGA